jgi:hypothetical protein
LDAVAVSVDTPCYRKIIFRESDSETRASETGYAKAMLRFLRGRVSNRKLRLFAVACCREITHLLTDPRSAAVIEVAEAYTARKVKMKDLRKAEGEARAAAAVVQPAYADDPKRHVAGYPLMYAANALREAAGSSARRAYPRLTSRQTSCLSSRT